MKKIDYLKLAINNKLYNKKAWIISAFSITKENADRYKSDSYLYRLVRQDWGYSFIDENQQLVKIDDANIKEPLFRFKDKITIDPSWLINVNSALETTIGRLLFNAIALVNAFNDKIQYINTKIVASKIEDIIAAKLQDTPKDINDRTKDNFYIDEYILFTNALQYLSGLSQLTIWAATPRGIVAPIGIEDFKKELLIKYKGKLSDPVELSKYEKELLDFDSEYLKGDPSDGTFMSGKVKDIARKKMFLSMGTNDGFDNSLSSEPILNSLNDGWPTDPAKFTSMMNGSRSGSYSRGAETVKGGVSAKILLRSANNFTIRDNDCGTNLGIHRQFNSDNIEQLIGRYVIVNNKTINIENKEMASNYIDKDIIVRSPMYCKLEGDNLCKICAGDKLSQFPTGLTIPLTDVSSIILYTSMGAMHGSVLSVSHLDLKTTFS